MNPSLGPSLKTELLIDSVHIGPMVSDYFHFFFSLLPYIVFISVLVEFFTGGGVEKILMKTLGAVSILTIFNGVYESSVTSSIEAAASYTEPILEKIQEAKRTTSGHEYTGIFSLLGSTIAEIADKFILALVSILATIGPAIAKVTFSFGYYITYLFFPLQILLFMLPNFERAMFGAVASWLWVLIFPHVFGSILVLLNDEFFKAFAGSNSGSVPMEKHIILIAFSILLAVTPAITYGMVMGSGIIGLARGFNLVMANNALHLATLYSRVSSRNPVIGGAKAVNNIVNPKKKSTGANNWKGEKSYANKTGNPFQGRPVHSGSHKPFSPALNQPSNKQNFENKRVGQPTGQSGASLQNSTKIHPSQFDSSIPQIPKERMNEYKAISKERRSLKEANSLTNRLNKGSDPLLQKDSSKRTDPSNNNHRSSRHDHKKPSPKENRPPKSP